MRPVRTHLSEQSLSLIGVPKKLQKLEMKDFDTYDSEDLEKIKSFFISYISDLPEKFETNSGILLRGSNGVGKTFIASMIVKEAYRRRYTARRTTFVGYISKYTDMWFAKTHEEKESFETDLVVNFKGVDFLALEEVGKEIDTKISIPILEDLLRYREEKGLVTILCTNLSLDVLKSRYGGSVVSLLKGNTTPIRIEGADKRQEYFEERKGDKVD